MSVLNFPWEVTLQFIQKMNYIKRYNLSIAVPRLSPLCFDRTVDRKSMKTITLNQLHQWFKQSSTDEERKLCFEANIFDRLRISNFNEVIHLHMDSDKNERFADNPKILQSLKAKIVLDGETEDLSQEFWDVFLCLLDKVEGDFLLAFMNVKSFENINLERYKEIISRKRNRGDKFYSISYHCNLTGYGSPLVGTSSFFYFRGDRDDDRDVRIICHSIDLMRKRSLEITKLVIEMINDVNKISDCKRHLVAFLPKLEMLQKEVIPEGVLEENLQYSLWFDEILI